MRLLSRLIVIMLITCLVALALPAVPAQAQDEASIYLSPDDGVPGKKVTIYGYNFTPQCYVDIYYDGSRLRELYVDGTVREYVKTDENGDFEAEFFVPESYSGDHEVLAEDTDDVKASDDFTVEPGLTVDPDEGTVGTTVTVEGHGFAKDEEDIELRYYVNGADYETVAEDIEADDDGWWEVSFQIPSSARGNHDIDAKGYVSRLYEVKDVTFEVMPGIHILDGPSGSIVEEPSGSPGESITMMGSGFAADERDITILFEGEAVLTELRADDKGYWEASFVVPAMPTGTYSVTAEGEWTPEEDITALSFEIGPGLMLSPDEGHVGMNLTVTGGGFATQEDVAIKYDGNEIATAVTNEEGSFELSFLVPEGKHGAHNVTAEVDGETEAAATFTMESDAPDIPELISPSDGDRVGFIGRVRPTFNWTAVADVSGVYYSLQISASANVTASGEFVNPIVSKEGLVATNYTLNATEALPYGTYYWIVQAVDGAENESGWTEPRSIRVGVMPLWGFILSVVGAVALIGTAVYYFIIRKRIYYY